jgi:ATP-dependent DNA helicase PIF1
MLEIPEELCFKIEEKTIKNPTAEKDAMIALADHVYPNLTENIKISSWMDGRAILAPTNKQVDAINNLIIDTFPGQPCILTSSDELSNPDDMSRFHTEYLNSLSPAGLPTHRLFLKPGMPLMLLRNLNPKMGLCNGTRLIFQKVHRNFLLECNIVGGEFTNRKILIPRITLKPKDREFTFEWSRRQFPVRVCFAMTINKSQGQTLKNIGVWLNDSCFAHGQLYVAVSRVGSPDQVKFAIRRTHGSPDTATRNVVFKEVFRSLNRE